MDERRTIAQWESDSGKHSVTLYSDAWGYGYDGTGCGGFLGKYSEMTEEQALAWVEPKTAGGAAFFHPGKRPMRRVI